MVGCAALTHPTSGLILALCRVVEKRRSPLPPGEVRVRGHLPGCGYCETLLTLRGTTVTETLHERTLGVQAAHARWEPTGKRKRYPLGDRPERLVPSSPQGLIHRIEEIFRQT